MSLRSVFVIGGLVIICAAGYGLYRMTRPGPTTDNVKAESKPPSPLNQIRFAANSPQLAYLQIVPALALPEPLIEPLNGRFTYDENRTARISSPIAGRIVKIGVQPGDKVKAGQPLLWIDSPEYSGANADFAKSQADLQQKQVILNRAKSLYEGEVLARKELESAQADFKQSEVENRRAQQRLSNLTQGMASNDDKYVLRSPIDGVVAERKVNPGIEVRPDATDPLFIVTDSSSLWIIIDVPEKYLGKVAVGQKITVEVDAYPGGDFVGQIASIGEVLDPATRRVQVRCTISNPQRRLKPEMYARVTPVVDESRKLVRISNTAIITEGLYSFVFIEKEPGLFEKKRITPGLQGREESYIRDGIAQGERVVTNGALLLNAEMTGRN